MIGFQDFAPEELRSALLRANRWTEEKRADAINNETVVLPNIHTPHEEGSEDTQLTTSADFSTSWHQFIRVWYKSE